MKRLLISFQYPSIISYDESGNEEELSIQPISLIRSSKKRVKPTHDVKKKKKRRRSKGKKESLPNDVAPITHCDDDNCYTIGAICRGIVTADVLV